MSATTTARPFQVGDRVRITDHNRHSVSPDVQHVFEGVVSRIDPGAAPESGHDFGPFLWIDTEPFVNGSGATHTATFCPLTDDMTADLTAASDPSIGRAIELLEPAPTNTSGHGPLAAPLSDRTLAKVLSRPAYVPAGTPSPADQDRRHAAERALAALVEWRQAGDVKAHIHATVALRKAADEYIAVQS